MSYSNIVKLIVGLYVAVCLYIIVYVAISAIAPIHLT